MAPTNGENAVRIDNLETRIDRHSAEWDERFEHFADKVYITMDKISDKLSQVAESFLDRIHQAELAAEKYDKENQIKIAKLAVKVAMGVSIFMTTFGLVLAAVLRKL